MIFIVGGNSQGKREFARGILGCESESGWTDGAQAGWADFMKGCRCFNFHLFIRRLMDREPSLGKPGAAYRPGNEAQFEEDVIRALMAGNPNRILVTDEVGYGIVPIDPLERCYREETGRICCLAAKEAEQVWRVCCGLGQRIK